MLIERHNLAAPMVLKLLLEGSHGNCYILADAGSITHLGDLGALDARLPNWLVSDSELVCEGLCCEALRPDILIATAQPPYLHSKLCTCMGHNLCAAPLENHSGLWRWDSAQQPVTVTVINFWKSSNSMSA